MSEPQTFWEHACECPQCGEVLDAFFGEMPQPHRLCEVGQECLAFQAEVTRFMQEWDRGEHQLSPEDAAALERAKPKLFADIRRQLKRALKKGTKE